MIPFNYMRVFYQRYFKLNKKINTGFKKYYGHPIFKFYYKYKNYDK